MCIRDRRAAGRAGLLGAHVGGAVVPVAGLLPGRAAGLLRVLRVLWVLCDARLLRRRRRSVSHGIRFAEPGPADGLPLPPLWFQLVFLSMRQLLSALLGECALRGSTAEVREQPRIVTVFEERRGPGHDRQALLVAPHADARIPRV